MGGKGHEKIHKKERLIKNITPMHTFSTKQKSTQPLHSKARRQRHRNMQADFMWHLYKNDFTTKEIAKVYGISRDYVNEMINNRLRQS